MIEVHFTWNEYDKIRLDMLYIFEAMFIAGELHDWHRAVHDAKLFAFKELQHMAKEKYGAKVASLGGMRLDFDLSEG